MLWTCTSLCFELKCLTSRKLGDACLFFEKFSLRQIQHTGLKKKKKMLQALSGSHIKLTKAICFSWSGMELYGSIFKQHGIFFQKKLYPSFLASVYCNVWLISHEDAGDLWVAIVVFVCALWRPQPLELTCLTFLQCAFLKSCLLRKLHPNKSFETAPGDIALA